MLNILQVDCFNKGCITSCLIVPYPFVVLSSNKFLFLVCNYTLTPPSYQFSSPGYPSSYPNNAYCEYHFKVPQDKAIRIYYNQFSLESSLSCTYDSVKLYEKGIPQATYCGYKYGFSWNSKESQVLMIFKSDALASSSGFYGSFSLTTKRKSLVQNYNKNPLYNFDDLLTIIWQEKRLKVKLMC